jgi:dihydrofolate synthase/folylpolyglutamate synthase
MIAYILWSASFYGLKTVGDDVMFKTYEEALNWIHSRLRLGIKPGLARMEWMMKKLGHPETKLPSVHVAGTNGKGSTVTYLRNILQASGLKVGTFTSPFFERFNERISINGEPIADEDLVKGLNEIYPLIKELEETDLGSPTEFEIITMLAFYHFAHTQEVDMVIFEVGLGGRLDSTNVIEPVLSVITNIGYDHTQLLGNSLAEIAFEKAGIMKDHTPVICAVQQPEGVKVMNNRAAETNSKIWWWGTDFKSTWIKSFDRGEVFSYKSPYENESSYTINMIGKHQVTNASLAIRAAEFLKDRMKWPIDHVSIQNGLEKAYWPGRLEVLSENPVILLDGAHNAEGMASFTEVIKQRYPNKYKTIFYTSMADKPLNEMVKQVGTLADELILVEFDFARAAKSKDLFSLHPHHNKKISLDWKKDLRKKIISQNKEEVILITGSLYFLSEVKPYILEIFKKTEYLNGK